MRLPFFIKINVKNFLYAVELIDYTGQIWMVFFSSLEMVCHVYDSHVLLDML